MTETAESIEPYMTVDDVAAYIQMSKDFVYRNRRLMAATKLGKCLRFRREDIDRFMRNLRV